jgi:hypothetical protein
MIFRERFADRDGWFSGLAKSFEQTDHAPFKVETDVENKVGARELGGVVGGRFVEVGIHAGPHEVGDFDTVASDGLDEVAEHGNGDDGIDRCMGGGVEGGGPGKGEGTDEDGEEEGFHKRYTKLHVEEEAKC